MSLSWPPVYKEKVSSVRLGAGSFRESCLVKELVCVKARLLRTAFWQLFMSGLLGSTPHLSLSLWQDSSLCAKSPSIHASRPVTLQFPPRLKWVTEAAVHPLAMVETPEACCFITLSTPSATRQSAPESLNDSWVRQSETIKRISPSLTSFG